MWGDQAYRGQTQVIRECAPQAQDCTHRCYRYKNHIDEVERAKNRTKSTVRSKVEHVFGMMKLKFGFAESPNFRQVNEDFPLVSKLEHVNPLSEKIPFYLHLNC